MKKLLRNKKGFTLTELIVVIAILGVLAAVVTPSVLSYLSDAKVSADAANLSTIDGCVKRLAAKGTIDLNSDWTQADSKTAIINAIKTEIQTIPSVNDTTKKKWVINKDAVSGKSVWATQEAAGAESAVRLWLN